MNWSEQSIFQDSLSHKFYFITMKKYVWERKNKNKTNKQKTVDVFFLKFLFNRTRRMRKHPFSFQFYFLDAFFFIHFFRYGFCHYILSFSIHVRHYFSKIQSEKNNTLKDFVFRICSAINRNTYFFVSLFSFNSFLK